MVNRLSFSDILALLGLAAAIILVVLDKAGKLRGSLLLWLLAVSAALTLPFFLNFTWVTDAQGLAKLSRSLLMICIVGLLYSLLAVWVTADESGKASPRNLVSLNQTESAPSPPSNQPSFSERITQVRVSLGENGYSTTLRLPLSGEPHPIVTPDMQTLGYVHLEKGYLSFDMDIFFSYQRPSLKLRGREITDRPPEWDLNSDALAFEIVDEQQRPRLQLIYKTSSHIVINGIFLSGHHVYFVDDDAGVQTFPAEPRPGELSGPKGFLIKRLFKYPSMRHQGERESITDSIKQPPLLKYLRTDNHFVYVSDLGNVMLDENKPRSPSWRMKHPIFRITTAHYRNQPEAHRAPITIKNLSAELTYEVNGQEVLAVSRATWFPENQTTVDIGYGDDGGFILGENHRTGAIYVRYKKERFNFGSSEAQVRVRLISGASGEITDGGVFRLRIVGEGWESELVAEKVS